MPLDRACPECGLAVWATVEATVDPPASSLPRLRRPHAVGNSLLWLMISQTLATLLLVTRPVAITLERLNLPWLAGRVELPPPAWLPWLAVAAALTGLPAVWQLLRPPSERPEDRAVYGRLRLVAVAILGWCGFVAVHVLAERVGTGGAWVDWLHFGLHVGLFATAALNYLGLRELFDAIGRRSRAYRTARGGRQGAGDMVAAVAGAATGEVLVAIGLLAGSEWLATIGRVVLGVSVLMIVIGQAYLTANAMWIRSAIRRPPPRLQEVVAVAPEAATAPAG